MESKKTSELVSKPRTLLFTSITVTLIVAFLQFIGPLAAKQWIETLSTKNILFAVGIIVLCFVLIAVINWGYTIFRQRTGAKIKADMSAFLVGEMLQLNYQELISKEPTYLFEKIQQTCGILFTYYADTIPDFFANIVVCLGCVLASVFVDIRFLVALGLILLVQVFGYKNLNETLSKMCVDLQNASARKYALASSLLGNVDYVKQLEDTSGVCNILKEQEQKERMIEANINVFAGKVSVVFDTILSILSNGAYIYIPIALAIKWISVGDSVYLALITGMFMPAAKRLVGCHLNMKDVNGARQFLEELFSSEEIKNDHDIDEEIHSISFDMNDLSIGGESLISSGKAEFIQGDIVKVMGETGCGKTTLMKSLLRFIPAEKISINGKDITTWDLTALRREISYVPQLTTIFSGTVRENILFGSDNKTGEDAIHQACTGNILEQYIINEIGLNTPIYENGTNLSGGDKQKIALARTLINNWNVLIMDESTSAMDEETESAVLDFLTGYCKQKHAIVFIISHSNTVDRFCNKTLKIENRSLIVNALN